MVARRWLVGASVPALFVALATASHAADVMPLPAEDAGPPIYDWSGFYIGGHLGYLGLDSDGFFATSVDLALCGSSFLGGAEVGWNWQFGSWVVGVEPDLSFFECRDVNLREEHYVAEADFLGTLRGRVGWADDNVLFYGTAGLAYLRARVETSLGGLDLDQIGNEDSKDVSALGGVAGAGIEWGLTRRFSVKAEALYLFFDEEDSLAALIEGCAPGLEGCLPVGTNFFSIDDGFVFRVGANWRLWAPPDSGADSVLATHGGPAAIYDWSGFYIGAHVGYGGVDNGGVYMEDRISPVPNPAPIRLGELENYGLLGGGQIGFNWQISSFVLGLEGDVAGVDWDDLIVDLQIPVEPQTVALDLDLLATARARIGWAADDLLFYLTGGVAYLAGEFEGVTIPGSKDVSAVGGAFGGGVEWGVTRDLSLRAEALYLAFDDDTSLAGVTDEASSGDHVEIDDGYALRLGANWRFGQEGTLQHAAYRGDHAPAGTSTGFDWTGVYIGGHLGVGGLVTDGIYNPEVIIRRQDPAANQAIDLTGVDNLGALGGGQIGWNWQVRSVVWGVEGDVAAVDWSGEEAEFAHPEDVMEFESDVLATARGRVGWAEDDLLLYLTGGVAFVDAELDNTRNEGGTTKDVDALGGVAGLGMEWGTTRNLSLKLEGLFLFFDEDTDIEDIGSEGEPGDFFRIDDGFIARLGANWRFNPFH